MKVILLQDISKFGKKFETKDVADGFANNFLFPQKLAKLATSQALKEIEIVKQKNKAEQQVKINKAKKFLERLKQTPVEIKTSANEEGKLFASIDKTDIIKAVQEKDEITLEPNWIILEKPIKTVGEHKVGITLEGEKSELNINIIAKNK